METWATYEREHRECTEELHQRIRENPALWRIATRPLGVQQGLCGPRLLFANCTRCHSTLAVELVEH